VLVLVLWLLLGNATRATLSARESKTRACEDGDEMGRKEGCHRCGTCLCAKELFIPESEAEAS
jgi:hypothetical protein